MDVAAIERYLRFRVPEAQDLRVVGLQRVFPGISRETWLTDVHWEQDGERVARGFVFRLDTPGGSIVPLPLSYEYEIYARLQGSGLPIARTFWYECDPQWLMEGREFYVREKLEGAVEIPHLGDPQYKAMHIEMAKEHAEKLALVHTLDWQGQGFAELREKFPEWRVPRDEAECTRLDLELWEKIFYEVQPEPYPAMAYVLAWLKEHMPQRAPRISLVKGNNGMSEEIWQGTKIVGLSDWEVAHLGDPTEDWAWAVVQGIDQLWEVDQILAHYEQASGISIDRESLSYFYVLVWFKVFACLQAGGRMFIAGKDQRVQVASLTLFSHLFLEQMAKASGLHTTARGLEDMRYN